MTENPAAAQRAQAIEITPLPTTLVGALGYPTLLVAIGLAVFGRGVSHALVDDEYEVIFNPGYWLVPWAGGQFRPIYGLLLKAERYVFALDPTGYHAVTLSAHLLSVLAVYWLGRLLTKHDAVGAVIALFFVVYPRHHVAALLTSVHVPLATLFGVLAVGLFFLYKTGKGKWSYVLSVIVFAFTLLSYEVGVMVLPLLALVPLLLSEAEDRAAGWHRGVLIDLVPYVAIAGLFLAVAFSGKAAQRLASTGGHYHFIGFNVRFLKAFLFYETYLFFPWIPMARLGRNVSTLLYFGSTALLLGTLLAKGGRIVRFATLWAVLSVLPFVAFGSFGPLDHYFHFAAVGVAILAGVLVANIRRRLLPQNRWAANAVASLLMAGYVALGAIRSSEYVSAWIAAGNTARDLVETVQQLYPTIPRGSTMYFVGIPRDNGLAPIFNNGIAGAMRLLYDDPSIKVAYTFDSTLVARLIQNATTGGGDGKPGVYAFAWRGKLFDVSPAYQMVEGSFGQVGWIWPE